MQTLVATGYEGRMLSELLRAAGKGELAAALDTSHRVEYDGPDSWDVYEPEAWATATAAAAAILGTPVNCWLPYCADAWLVEQGLRSDRQSRDLQRGKYELARARAMAS